MKKGTKRFLTAGALILGLLIIAMILIPALFKGKIKDAVLKTINENVNAEVKIEDFGLNLFTKFPNASLSLYNTTVVGVDTFAADTLAQIKELKVTIDLKSLFTDNYKISQINVNDAKIYTKVSKTGLANWDIAKTSATTDNGTEVSSDSTAFVLELDDVKINNSQFIYDDQESNIKALLSGLSGNLKGDFTAQETTLKIKANSDQFSVLMDGIPYLSKINLVTTGEVAADFNKMKFTFKDTKAKLNDLVTTIEGSFAMVNDDDISFDLSLGAPDANFKQVLSLIPAMYNDDLKKLKTSGDVALNAHIIGDLTPTDYPGVKLDLVVKNAMFQYPSLPKAVNDINLNLLVNGKGNTIEDYAITVDRFGFRIDDNTVKGSLRMLPIGNKDQKIEFASQGKLNLASIKDVYPLEEGTELSGMIDADFALNALMSAITHERYDNIAANGHFLLKDAHYTTSELPALSIKNVDVNFSSQFVNLNDFDLLIGKSDIQAKGRLDNLIGYALKNQTLKGGLTVKSKLLDLDEIMSSMTEDENATKEEAETDPLSSLKIPQNLDLNLTATLLEKVIFDGLDITNISGAINVKDGAVSLNNVGANALGGVANLDARLNTQPEVSTLNMDVALTRVSFNDTFKAFETVQKLAPIFNDIEGTYSLSMKYSSSLYADNDKTLNSINADGEIITRDLKLEGNEALKKLGSLLKTDKLDAITTKDMTLPFAIKNGELATKPFTVNVGDGGELNLSGVTKLDQSINYAGTIQLPKSIASDYLSKVPLTITGTFTSPSVSIDTESVVKDAIGSAVSNLFGIKKDENGDVSAGLQEEKEKKIAEIRATADDAAKRLVEEAKSLGDQLVEKAGSNKLAEIAAKKAAEKGVKEAEKQAQALRDKAEEQIKKLEAEESVDHVEE